MITITITVEKLEESIQIQQVLQEAEENLELDFPFGYKVDETLEPQVVTDYRERAKEDNKRPYDSELEWYRKGVY